MPSSFGEVATRTLVAAPCSAVLNNGGIPHNLRIDGLQTPNIDPQASATLKVTFTKPGRYPYLCTIPGHAEAGMNGVLTVK
jgi:uncharacterized cupredoxin-like copper-binding protein